jgi:hypothetical protein
MSFEAEQNVGAPLSLEWIGGFFDGEGSISIHVRRFSIDVQVSFTQVYRKILENVNSFFEENGVVGGTVYAERGGRINRLVFSSNRAVLEVLVMLEPALRIKRAQAEATIGYLLDKLRGDEFLSTMNQEVRLGRRGGMMRTLGHEWTRSVGIKRTRQSSMAKARSVYSSVRKSFTKKH